MSRKSRRMGNVKWIKRDTYIKAKKLRKLQRACRRRNREPK